MHIKCALVKLTSSTHNKYTKHSHRNTLTCWWFTSANAQPLSPSLCVCIRTNLSVCVCVCELLSVRERDSVVFCGLAAMERTNKQQEAAITIRVLHLTHRTIISVQWKAAAGRITLQGYYNTILFQHWRNSEGSAACYQARYWLAAQCLAELGNRL